MPTSLDRLLDGSSPPVTAESPELRAAIRTMTRDVGRDGRVGRPARIRTRFIVSVGAVALAIGLVATVVSTGSLAQHSTQSGAERSLPRSVAPSTSAMPQGASAGSAATVCTPTFTAVEVSTSESFQTHEATTAAVTAANSYLASLDLAALEHSDAFYGEVRQPATANAKTKALLALVTAKTSAYLTSHALAPAAVDIVAKPCR